MITEMITSGQSKQLKRVAEDAIDSAKLTKAQAEEILKNGGLVKKDLQDSLKKHSIVDKRFGPPLKEIQLTVPKDYDPDTQLEKFGRKTKGKESTYYYNDNLTDKNFSEVSHKLVPGKTYTVKFIPINSLVSSQDCLEEYKRHNAVLVGAQGITTLQETHPDIFPKGKWLLSFDEKENLWQDTDGVHRVPRVGRGSDGDWNFSLVYFVPDWSSDGVLVVFCEKQTSDS